MYSGNSRRSGEPVPLVHERRMFNSIRWRLVALNVLVLTIILVVLELGVYSILFRSI